MGTGMLAQSIEYKEGFGAKQMAWLLHTSVLGAMLAPMCFMGGPLLIRAAWYTAGVVGGLSTIAVSQQQIICRHIWSLSLTILKFFNEDL